MPFDDLAQMRAEMLMRQDPNVYDDGASQLGMNPYMQQVGLFGKGKPKPVAPPIDIQRRAIFGLKPQAPLPDNLPAVRSSDVPVPNAVPVPQAPAQPAPTTTPLAPLGQMANKALNTPISRREVLKKTGQVALNQMLPTPKVADVVPEIVSPLAKVTENAFVPNPTIDEYLGDYVSNMFSEATANEPLAATTSMYTFIRDYLDGRVPEKELKKYDKLHDRAQKYYDDDDEYSDKATDVQSRLEDFIHDKLNLLKPDELYEANSNLHEEGASPEELFDYIAETSGGQGLDDDDIVGKKAFVDYMNKALKWDE